MSIRRSISAAAVPVAAEGGGGTMDAALLDQLAAAGPLLAGDLRRFAGQDGAGALVRDLAQRLERLATQAADNPFANPVQLLALDVSRRLRAKELDLGAVEQAIQYLAVEGFLRRAQRLGAYLGPCDPQDNQDRLTRLITGLTREDGRPVPFERFRERVEREIFGIVITAHPTFNLTGGLMTALTVLATGRAADGGPLDADARAALVRDVAAAEIRPGDITLDEEHALSLRVLANIQTAVRRVYDIVFQVAQTQYPDDWLDLTPRLLTVASWVGYDLDGRSDIHWSDSLHKRLLVQVSQLRDYLEEVRAIRAASAARQEVRALFDLLESRLALAIAQTTDEVAVFAAGPADVAAIQRIARRMHEGLGLRLVDAAFAIDQVDRALRLLHAPGGAGLEEGDGDPSAVLRRLAILKANLANFGLGRAHTHVRINATQLHNAIRKTVGMETAPDDPRYRQSYLAALTGLLDEVRPVRINFASVMAERTSAKRLFMVVAQMLKYADATVPVRFLIAETESAFTVLTALYYARLFGVDERVDISPLFETEKALELGSRVIEQLLENPHYRAYVRRRGRLCIQTGYSDAGRYLGQTPAAASIERLRLRVARLFIRHDLGDVQLVIFDTHGESIGRGAHPGGFAQRLAYIATPATLRFLKDNAIAFKQEVSFQGGDGFAYFITPDAALAALTRVLEHMLGDEAWGRLEDDPFYEEADYIREFFTTVKQFQVGLVEDPCYGALLSALGTNLLYPSGSRAIKRQYDGAAPDIDHSRASQFRAIPHNAILQQMGLPANTVGGVGEAIAKDPQRFADLYAQSPRFRQVLGMVEHGVAIASPDALKAYIDSLDPAFWLLRAAHAADPAEAEEMRALAALLEENPTHPRLIRIFRKLYRDFDMLGDGLARLAARDGAGKETDGAAALPARDRIAVLHALRIALVQEVFLLATHIPRFSSQHAITHAQLLARLLQLDVPWALELLVRIFPATGGDALDGDFGEVATYVSADSQNYGQENARLFTPMERLHALILRAGNGITQHIGFLG